MPTLLKTGDYIKMIEINYTNHYFNLSREKLLEVLKNKLSNFRFNHVLRVEQKALELATRYQYENIEQVSIAALVHDYAKEFDDELFINKIKDKALDPDLLNWGNMIWHGVVGAEFIHDDLKITDEDILNAVRHHTVGATYMTLLDKIIYMADYIEDGRDFPEVAKVREITFKNIDEGVAWQTLHTIEYLLNKKVPIYPQTINTYNVWVAKK